MQGFVDRVVDGVAVILLEHGGRVYVRVSELPPGVAAGRLVEVSFALAQSPEGLDEVEAVAQRIERLRAGDHRHERGGHEHGGHERDGRRHG